MLDDEYNLPQGVASLGMPQQIGQSGFSPFAGSGGGGGGGGGGGTPTPAPLPAALASNEYLGLTPEAGSVLGDSTTGGTTGGSTINRAGVSSEILTKIDSINNVFKTLFSGVDKLLKDRSTQLTEGSATTQADLLRQAGQEQNLMGRMFAARGLGDSDFRTDAERNVGDEFNRLSTQENQTLQSELANLGQLGTTTKADFTASQESVNRYKELLGQMSDQDLVSAQEELNNILATRQAQAAGFNTEAGFQGELNKAVPFQSRLPQLRQQLIQVAQANAPAAFKEQVIRGILSQSGASKQEEDALVQEFLAQIS